MEWEKQPPPLVDDLTGGSCGGMFVKVMTDEQMEVLRKQIAVYATICEQLVELHKSLTAQNDLAGVRLGSTYYDPLISSGTHKISGRQRWTPTPLQLQHLENIFDKGNGTPSRPKIREITAELSQHGQINDQNVYNWFQNRRARSKRKQQANNTTQANDAESEVETEVESFDERKGDDFEQNKNVASKHDLVGPGEGSLKLDGGFEQMSFYENMLPNSSAGMDHLIGKMELPGNYEPYLHEDDYNLTG